MHRFTALMFATLLLGPAACGGGGSPAGTDDPAEPAFSTDLFSANSHDVGNAHFPLRPGTTRIYLLETDEGVELVVEDVLEETRMVAGVACAVVLVREYLDGLLIEETRDWYAQDDEGNIWYLGEAVVNYEYDEEDELIGTNDDGAWEAGVDGAEPGIIMKADPQPGDSYRQEFYEGEAEDMAEIVALDVPVVLDDGSLHLCVQTRDWNPLEPDSDEFKYYAPGIGLVMESDLEGEDRVELQGIFDRTPDALADFGAATFSNPTLVTNGFFPLVPGSECRFEAETEDGTEETLVEVLAGTRLVAGVECVVVRDRVYLDGLLLEDTHDWYAQDDDGNVWYMGEEVVNYEYDDDDNLIGTDDDGSWEAGVDGAQAGILMWAEPAVGVSYYQEFLEDEAVDMAVVVEKDVEVELSDGTTYDGCLRVLERTALEAGVIEAKYYAPGFGVVLEEKPGGEETVERVTAP